LELLADELVRLTEHDDILKPWRRDMWCPPQVDSEVEARMEDVLDPSALWYKRNGTANLFIFLDVHRPWRKVKDTDSRTAVDFATCMRELATFTSPRPSASASCSTICRPTRSVHFI
jgi:hypothetical protein